jgi:transposase InsO family protein
MENEKEKRKVLEKLHRYFGHVSPKSLYRILKASSAKERFTEADIRKINNDCFTCNTNKRKMNRKKTSLPRATGFNQVVTMDLKVHSTTEYVLWCVDDATRFIRGEVVKDKKPETILEALERAWIIGRGAGPGLPEKYFFSDNGGEFVNETMTNFLQQAGIRLKTTGSFSPQQNGRRNGYQISRRES